MPIPITDKFTPSGGPGSFDLYNWPDIDSATLPTTLSGYGITDAQPLDATLTALAGLNATAGLVEQTGADLFTKRLIGVVNATDILTRADGDGRYSQLGHTHSYQPLDSDLTDIAGLTVAQGSLLIGSVTPAWSLLSPNTTATKKHLSMTSSVGSWDDLSLIYSPLGHTHSYQPVDADLTSIAGITATGIAVRTSNSPETWGTLAGITALGTANYIPGMNAAGNAMEWKQLIQGSNITITHAANAITIEATGGVSTHSLLQASVHTDTADGTVQRGDLITGQGTTAKWTRLAKGTAYQIPAMDASAVDIGWVTLTSNHLPATVLYTTGTQTITGIKKFDTVTAGEGLWLLGEGGMSVMRLESSVPANSYFIITESPTGDLTYTIPNQGADAEFVMSEGAQTINGAKQLSTAAYAYSNSITSGFAFKHSTSTTKVLRMDVGSAGTYNHAIKIPSTSAARTWTTQNDDGTFNLLVAPSGSNTDKTGQTGNLGPITIYTTVHAGFYKVSAYFAFTAYTSTGTWNCYITYTDPYTTRSIKFMGDYTITAVSDYNLGTYYFYATASSTISYTVNWNGVGTYSFFIRVEGLS